MMDEKRRTPKVLHFPQHQINHQFACEIMEVFIQAPSRKRGQALFYFREI
jgi:hypothetical protein